MHPLLKPAETASPRIAIVDGSAGLRRLLASMVRQHFRTASIEDIDPFSQTMRGAGFAFGTRGDAVILGGVGTESEARDALKRLRSRADCPPIVMLVADALMPLRSTLMAEGAFDVLRKDAVSSARLNSSIERAMRVEIDNDGKPITHIAPLPAAYGKFHFVFDGERTALEIDGYRFLSTLSATPLAHVFFAESIASEQRVVIKVLTSFALHDVQDTGWLDEVTTRLQPLRGNSAVAHLDSGIAATYPYVVMEFLTHGDLRRRMKSPMELPTKVDLMVRVLDALVALHDASIVHSDLKPESIFFRGDGSATLIDFNISVVTGKAVRASAKGDVLGTPTYMSPEQGAGKAVDGRSDLYSAGIIFFEMLTGIPPFSGSTPAQTIYSHLHDEVPLLPLKARHLQSVIDKLLAKQPEERYSSAAEVLAELKRVQQA
jgi:DNA-binding response OmpR family regulator